LLLLWILLTVAGLPPGNSVLANNPGESGFESIYAPQGEEVLLSFRYRGVGNVYITGLYDYSVNKMYLPVSELFSLLQIYYEPYLGDFALHGTFLIADQPFHILFTQQKVILKDKEYAFDFDDFRIGELDLFLSPLVFEEVFGMYFTIDMNTLVLSLETDHTMPIEEAIERERARRLIEAREVTRELFPLEYDRNRRLIGFGFADYNISGTFSQENPNMHYSVVGGAEVFGGDIQGNVTGSLTEDGHRIRASNLRWRYVVRDTPWFSTFEAGQIQTTGLQNRNIRGASISNNPVEPRRIYETYIVDGNTEPDSEVELYLNNRLIDFRRADAAGYYRFEFPLTYGTSQLTINIYTPSGELRIIDRRIQIPFTFLPPGEMAYNIQGGLTETFLGADDQEKLLFQGDVSLGVASWLTAKVGSEYIEDFNENRPLTYGSLSARVFSQYLLNVDIAPDAFYRGIASVMYPSGRSFSLLYTHYEDNPLFSGGGVDQDIQLSFYTPFNLFNTHMSFRLSGDYRSIGTSSATRYRTDFSMRLGRMNLRASYRDVLYYSDNDYLYGRGRVSGNVTYTFMRSPGIPVFVRGMFLRGNVSYSIADNTFEDMSLQLSRSIRQWGRINIDAGYDLRSEQFLFRLGFIMDWMPLRSTTNVDIRGDRTSIRQNFRGSLGFDRNPDRIVTNNRSQVGRAGASVILFVDNNNSGTFDEGDEIIPARAVRLDRSAQIQVGPDGVIRINQLQSYFRYNLEVVRAALPNPLLVPAKNRFSFVADPNQYKRIEIPFYRTGVVDGTVFSLRNGEKRSQGGLRLIVTGIDNDYQETIRNFSDGSFYSMDMPPGRYTIEVDPAQLGFLSAHMPEGPRVFEVRALADGDFIEDLNIIIEPLPDVEEVPEPAVAEVPPSITPADTLMPAGNYLQIGVFPKATMAEESRKRASDITGRPFQIREHDRFDLYVVYSGSIADMDDARNLHASLVNMGFHGAFIRKHTGRRMFDPDAMLTDVIRSDVPEYLPEEYLVFEEAAIGDQYYVVLNLFSTIYRAETARKLAIQSVDAAFFIRYCEEERLFEVFSHMMEDAQEASSYLAHLMKDGFLVARVHSGPMPGPEPMRYQIQLASHNTENQAKEHLESIRGIMPVSLAVEYDDYTGRYALRTASYPTMPEASKVLHKIRGIGDFSTAFMISSPRVGAIPIIHVSGD